MIWGARKGRMKPEKEREREREMKKEESLSLFYVSCFGSVITFPLAFP